MSFYSSNQAKLRKYTADRRVEEVNENKHQALVYASIAEQNASTAEADRLAKLGMDIVGKIAKTPIAITQKENGKDMRVEKPVIEHLAGIIGEGKLSQWWDAIKEIPERELSQKARLIVHDMNYNAMLKNVLNETLKDDVKAGASPKKMADDISQLLTGGDDSVLDEILTKVVSIGKQQKKKPREVNTKAGLADDLAKAAAKQGVSPTGTEATAMTEGEEGYLGDMQFPGNALKSDEDIMKRVEYIKKAITDNPNVKLVNMPNFEGRQARSIFEHLKSRGVIDTKTVWPNVIWSPGWP